MIYIYTAFKQNKPLISCVWDQHKNDLKFIPFYMPGTKLSLFDVENNKQYLQSLLNENKVVINNFKNHLRSCGLKRQFYDVYDSIDIPINLNDDIKSQLVNNIKIIAKNNIEAWQNLIVKASVIYQTLEDRGVLLSYECVYPKYDFTITGRSKTTEFNIQGATSDYNIRHVDENNRIFIQLDWISADLRAASILSNDENMVQSFKESDPYEWVSQQLKDPDITRDDCKLALLESIYSLNSNSPILELYPQFKNWMKTTIDNIYTNGYSETILKRKFILSDDNIKSVFNAIIQGTVAHAMHNSLIRIYELYPTMVLADLHDSIVLSCPQSLATKIISDVSKIMLNPLNGLVDSNPVFPIRVYVGKQWRQWKFMREYR